MNVGLIDCSLADYNAKQKYFLPLGLLSMAAVAEQGGHNAVLLELQDWLTSQDRSQKNAIQSSSFARVITEYAFDIIGFTTRCDNLPYVLEAASQCRSYQKGAIIVLGGPGASFCDLQILDTFSDIDIIVRGEGEATFAELLKELARNGALSGVRGITYRDSGSSVRQNPDRGYIGDLDTLPELPFYLIDAKLRRSNYTWTNVEAGRGCPQMCRFCSTCLFWGRRSRMRSPRRIVAELKFLHEEYDYDFFTLIHDNILADRPKFFELCDLIRTELPRIKWSVSASLNLTNPEIVKKMRNCGCMHVFVGVESVSQNGRINLSSKILPSEEIRNRLDLYRQHKIKTCNSYIIGFPNESSQDIDQTLEFAVEMKAASTVGLFDDIQIHPLSLHPGTSLYREYRDSLSSVSCRSDLADPIFCEMPACLELAEQYPTVFTAYASHLTAAQHARIVELCNFFSVTATVFPKSLAVALAELNLTPTQFLEYFKAKTDHAFDLILHHRVPLNRLESRGFLQSLPGVLREMASERGYSGRWIDLFLDYESPRLIPLFQARPDNSEMAQCEAVDLDQFIHLTPFVPSTTVESSFAYNMDDLFRIFLESPADAFGAHTTTTVFYYLPRNNWDDDEAISFAVRAVDALSARVYPWIDGERTCGEIAESVVEPLSLSARRQLSHSVIHKFLGQMAGSGLIGLSKNRIACSGGDYRESELAL